jgi:hypothetical protein
MLRSETEKFKEKINFKWKMAEGDIGKSFVQEFVLGFGFLSGIWIYAGVNPETEIIKAFSSIIQELSPNPMYSFLFWIVPIIGTLISLGASFYLGSWLGLIAVFFALIGGIFISSALGIICLVIGVILGFIAPYTHG